MPDTSFALAAQRMPATDGALVLSQIASWRKREPWFSTGDLRQLYGTLRLPEPGNLSSTLGRLRDRNPPLLRDRPSGVQGWGVTPEGAARAEELLGEFDYSAIAVELQAVSGAFFAASEYPTLPPGLAPPAWAPGLKSFLERFPFEHNVFLMTRFPSETDEFDPLEDVVQQLREDMRNQGLVLHVASDQQIVDDLWGNVGAHMWACRYGIGVLEVRLETGSADQSEDDETATASLNDNVLIELGSMLTIGRRCMILRDEGAPMPPTDLTSQIFKTVSLDDLDSISRIATEWVSRDLRLS